MTNKTEMPEHDPRFLETTKELCRELHKQLGRDAMLRQNDPVETLFTFVLAAFDEGHAEGLSDAATLQAENAELRARLDGLVRVVEGMEAFKIDYGAEMGMNEQALRAFVRDTNEMARMMLSTLDAWKAGKS